MENEITIIDAVEKIKAYLFALDPETESIREGLLSPKLYLDSPDFIMEAYLAVYLNLGLHTSEGRRQIHKLLSSIRDQDRQPVLLSEVNTISDENKEKISQGLHCLEDLISKDILKKEMESGIQKALKRLHLEKRLSLGGIKIYRFLSILGLPVAIGSPAKYRFLSRLGWIGEKGKGAKALREYHSLCENAARLTGESVQSLDFLFSLFSVKERKKQAILPVCGSNPKCALCVLTPYCVYYSLSVNKGIQSEDTSMPIRLWCSEDRPREQLEKWGASRLSDSQLIAIIIRSGLEKRSAVDLARELLCRFESLRNLAEASFTDLCSIRGIGKVKAIQIKAALELGKRGLENSRKENTIILESLDVFRQYRYELNGIKQESFFLLMLNSRNQVMKKVEISRGSLNASLVHPREVFREAIRESASRVLFFHNHPSGDPCPSRADTLITERLKKAGELLGIQVLDHIIIGEDSFYSFADHGLL